MLSFKISSCKSVEFQCFDFVGIHNQISVTKIWNSRCNLWLAIVKRVFLFPQILLSQKFCFVQYALILTNCYNNVCIYCRNKLYFDETHENRSSDFLLNSATSISRNNFDSFSTRTISLKFNILCSIWYLIETFILSGWTIKLF